jgi:hypothetical protein
MPRTVRQIRDRSKTIVRSECFGVDGPEVWPIRPRTAKPGLPGTVECRSLLALRRSWVALSIPFRVAPGLLQGRFAALCRRGTNGAPEDSAPGCRRCGAWSLSRLANRFSVPACSERRPPTSLKREDAPPPSCPRTNASRHREKVQRLDLAGCFSPTRELTSKVILPAFLSASTTT